VVILSKNDLQQAIALLEERDEGLPLRFTNYRGRSLARVSIPVLATRRLDREAANRAVQGP
jgi:hypothetical protein